MRLWMWMLFLLPSVFGTCANNSKERKKWDTKCTSLPIHIFMTDPFREREIVVVVTVLFLWTSEWKWNLQSLPSLPVSKTFWEKTRFIERANGGRAIGPLAPSAPPPPPPFLSGQKYWGNGYGKKGDRSVQRVAVVIRYKSYTEQLNAGYVFLAFNEMLKNMRSAS